MVTNNSINKRKNILLYINTLRYIKSTQVFNRFWYNLYKPSVHSHSIPGVRATHAQFSLPVEKSISMRGESEFIFLNKSGRLEESSSWNNPDLEKLWLYNLHYFDDLNAFDSVHRLQWHCHLINKWIVENPVGNGNGWEPYPLSIRIVNWIKWALQGNKLEPDWLVSLAIQTRFLRRRLEYHLLGNHLFTNAKALIYAGLFFSGDEAERWLKTGLHILNNQLSEQILADGGHFELSTMYHSIILEDLLDLVNLDRVYEKDTRKKSNYTRLTEQAKLWEIKIADMLRWLKSMCHPDGGVSFFNDAAFGIAPTLAELESYVRRLGIRNDGSSNNDTVHLGASGYIRLHKDPADVFLDVAKIGPDYIPGHAHADTLSFELSLYDQRVVVNSGISCYGTSKLRLQQRSTKMHSTVEINEQNSSEVWGGFRVARRAYPCGLNLNQDSETTKIRCGHDGYKRLFGKPIHWREWQLSNSKFEIIDTIEGRFESACSRLYIHPEVKVLQSTQESKGHLILKDGRQINWQVTGGNVNIRSAEYYPEFGRYVENTVIEVEFQRSSVLFTFEW